ncbi:MAG: (deoxy)nucleoside triphosphate pyrophosphohydrolase [Burkholderiaceae bacterium]|nr:(deoxy)nucleoside triphosphate pyrophosphohydrolase [Burkholderiaceae bacterium]
MNTEKRQTISVVAAVILHEGRVLAAKRKAGGPSGGMWEFAGGKVKVGELPRSALSREILEELGLQIRVGEEIGTYATQLGHLIIELKCFWCELIDGNLELNDHDEVLWCHPDEMEALQWALPDIPAVQDVLNSLRATSKSRPLANP